MEKDYKKIAELLKNYPNFSKEYHYMIDEIRFERSQPSQNLGPFYYMGGKMDYIVIHMILNPSDPHHIEALFITIMHELSHRIQAKKYPGEYDGEHGDLFKNVCSRLGLDPQGESEGKGERDFSKPYYKWVKNIIKNTY